MLSQTADMTNNRQRRAKTAGRAKHDISSASTNIKTALGLGKSVASRPGTTLGPTQHEKETQTDDTSHNTTAAAAATAATATAAAAIADATTTKATTHTLARPQNEATRHYYEALVLRGILLQQPHSVLGVAEAYHGWYHSSTVDVAGNILQQTIGSRRRADYNQSDGKDAALEEADCYDIRSTYWLALCYWHMGEVSAVYSLLGPISIESDYIIGSFDGDFESRGLANSGYSQVSLPSDRDSAKLNDKKALACGLWLLAMSCTRLEKWQEAEDYLTELKVVLKLIHSPDDADGVYGCDTRLLLSDISDNYYTVPTLADVLDMLGMICLRTNRTIQSEQHSYDSLRRNPLSWSACRRLCEIGSTQKLAQAFSGNLDHLATSTDAHSGRRHRANVSRSDSGGLSESTPMPSSRISSRASKTGTEAATTLLSSSASSIARPRKAGTVSRQAAISQHMQQSRIASLGTSDATASARMRTRLASQIPAAGANSANSSNISVPSTRGKGSALGIRGTLDNWIDPATRSLSSVPSRTPARSRTEAAPSVAVSEKKRSRNGTSLRSTSLSVAKDPPPSNTDPSGQPPAAASSLDHIAISHLYQMVKASGMVYAHASTYRAARALLLLAELPAQQQNSAWGLSLLGRICFESGRYPEASQAFGASHHLAPYRLRDMDMYSTLLWHMKKEEALAQLAHTMVSIGRNWSPEAWIAVANCFSLDGEHASAVKSLGRSIQLFKSAHGGTTIIPRSESGGVSGLAYAHTLVGHESAASDDLDRAQQAFRTAIRIDPRHYNAWYGMGMVYLRLGKLDLAEYHFGRALALNSQNPLLLQSAGAVYEHRGDYHRALEVYGRVEALLHEGYSSDDDSSDSTNPSAAVDSNGTVVLGLQSHHAMNFVMFKRARVMVVLGRFAEAADILELLLQRCPREFNVPFLLGQTYAKLCRYREAAACLTRALDIAPENSQSVNEAFDALYQQSSEDQGSENTDQDDQNHEDDDDDNNDNDNIGRVARNRDMRYRSYPGDLGTPPSEFGHSGDVVSPTSSSIGSPYFDSPSVYARGRRGQTEWSHDWAAMNNADDRVDRALDFDM